MLRTGAVVFQLGHTPFFLRLGYPKVSQEVECGREGNAWGTALLDMAPPLALCCSGRTGREDVCRTLLSGTPLALAVSHLPHLHISCRKLGAPLEDSQATLRSPFVRQVADNTKSFLKVC